MKTTLIALLIMGFSKVNEYPKPEKHWVVYLDEYSEMPTYLDTKSFNKKKDTLFFDSYKIGWQENKEEYFAKYTRGILLSSRSVLATNNIVVPAAEADNYDKIIAIYKQMLKEKKKGRKP
ncbi:MAG: hypothetical protein ACOVSW_00440 [Candidatus Kapaibacteriota bacterium]|jgi:hypothetical protein